MGGKIMICEDNPLIRQDLAEIVSAFDSQLEVSGLQNLDGLRDVRVERPHPTILIVNSNRKTRAHLDVIAQFQRDGGHLICIGSLGPTFEAPQAWVMVDAPFTNSAIHSALQIVTVRKSARTGA